MNSSTAHKLKGFVDPLTVGILAGLAAGFFFGSWKPLKQFQKGPPTAQVDQMRANYDAQLAAAEKARLELEANQKAERAKLELQLRAAQQDAIGAEAALKRVPGGHRTAEVNFADRMVGRVNLKLAVAIGRLPADQQEAMVELVEQALSGKQAEIDEANRRLAEIDEKFNRVTTERDALKREQPVLIKRLEETEADANAAKAEVNKAVEKLKTWAVKMDEADRNSSSFMASLERAAIVIGAIILFFMVGIPAIVKHMDSSNPLKGLLRDANGYFLNPLTYHDAKKKLRNLTPPP